MIKKYCTYLSVWLLFFVIALVAYYPVLDNSLVSDDIFQVINNRWITDFSHIREIFTSHVWGFVEFTPSNPFVIYRPMMHVVFAVEYYFFGLDFSLWHGLNLVWHSINAFLVFCVAVSLANRGIFLSHQDTTEKIKYLFAFVSGLVFLLHPVNTEVVNWIAAVPELSYTTLLLLSFLSFFSSKKYFRTILAPMLFFIALLCKETAIMFPFLLYSLDVFIFSKSSSLWSDTKLWVKSNKTLFVVMILYLSMYVYGISDIEREHLSWPILKIAVGFILMSPVILWKDVIYLVWPFPLTYIHNFDPEYKGNLVVDCLVYGAILVWCLLSYYFKVLKIRISDNVKLICIWFVLFLLPTCIVLIDINQTLSIRYLYFSSIAFSFAVAWFFVYALLHKKRLSYTVLFILSVICVISDIYRSMDWKDEKTMVIQDLRIYPDRTILQSSLAGYYALHGLNLEYQRVKQMLQKTDSNLDQADSVYSFAYIDMYSHLAFHDIQGALDRYKAVSGKDDDFISFVYRDMGVLYLASNDFANAENYLLLARQLNSKSQSISRTLGLYYCSQGNQSKAETYFSEALHKGDLKERIDFLRNRCSNEDIIKTFVDTNVFPLL